MRRALIAALVLAAVTARADEPTDFVARLISATNYGVVSSTNACGYGVTSAPIVGATYALTNGWNMSNGYLPLDTSTMSNLTYGKTVITVNMWVWKNMDDTNRAALDCSVDVNAGVTIRSIAPNGMRGGGRSVYADTFCNVTSAPEATATATWYMVTLEMNYGADTARFGINGVWVQSNTAVWASTFLDVQNYSATWQLGAAGSTHSLPWYGKLDDWQLYTRVLPEAELASIYSAGRNYVAGAAPPATVTQSPPALFYMATE